jgi:hypothetical protein
MISPVIEKLVARLLHVKVIDEQAIKKQAKKRGQWYACRVFCHGGIRGLSNKTT